MWFLGFLDMGLKWFMLPLKSANQSRTIFGHPVAIKVLWMRDGTDCVVCALNLCSSILRPVGNHQRKKMLHLSWVKHICILLDWWNSAITGRVAAALKSWEAKLSEILIMNQRFEILSQNHFSKKLSLQTFLIAKYEQVLTQARL